MNVYELIGRSIVLAAAALFLLTLFDLSVGSEPRALSAAQAFLVAIDGASQ
jgi:hypothetical protein